MNHYYLLPFRFTRIMEQELLVNELGDFIFTPKDTTERIIKRQINNQENIYKDLVANFFISERPIPELIDNMATRLRTKKAFLDSFTSLHIFVLTLRCNQNCMHLPRGRHGADRDRERQGTPLGYRHLPHHRPRRQGHPQLRCEPRQGSRREDRG